MHGRASWQRELLDELGRSGAAGAEAAHYLRAHGTRLRVRDQPTAARWTLGRSIELHPRYTQESAIAPYALSLLVHETQHLRQGPVTALSVFGELDAWQMQFRFLGSVMGAYPGTAEQVGLIAQLIVLPLGWNRAVLRMARSLMQQYAGRRYQIGLLPLYPLPRELLYAIAHRQPG